MRHIHKSFPGVKALDDVQLTLRAGEVMALLGEKRAGKSTLMKILSGVYTRDEGELEILGQKIEKDFNTSKAQQLGCDHSIGTEHVPASDSSGEHVSGP